MGQNAVVCLSGGMDSTSLLLHMLAHDVNVLGISFDYGQKHAIELQFLKRNLTYLREQSYEVPQATIDLAALGDLFHSALLDADWKVPQGHYQQENMKETVVPNRNAIFASIAYGYAWSVAKRKESKTMLGLGVHSGDHAIYPDCRPEFYEALFAAFQVGNWDAELVELYLPFLNMNKAEILRDAERSTGQLGLDFDRVFANTLTSYQPDAKGTASGLTGSDIERILAFREIGRKDPVQYAEPWEQVVERAEALQKNHHGS